MMPKCALPELRAQWQILDFENKKWWLIMYTYLFWDVSYVWLLPVSWIFLFFFKAAHSTKMATCGGVVHVQYTLSTLSSIFVFSLNVHQIKKYLFRLSLTTNVMLPLKNMPKAISLPFHSNFHATCSVLHTEMFHSTQFTAMREYCLFYSDLYHCRSLCFVQIFFCKGFHRVKLQSLGWRTLCYWHRVIWGHQIISALLMTDEEHRKTKASQYLRSEEGIFPTLKPKN